MRINTEISIFLYKCLYGWIGFSQWSAEIGIKTTNIATPTGEYLTSLSTDNPNTRRYMDAESDSVC